MSPVGFKAWLRDPTRKALVMGILNVTPDSFSDGGRFNTVQAAVDQARAMLQSGADLIDIGGESTRPGSDPVSPDEQIRRVVPVIQQLAPLGVGISIDTTKSDVARAALDAGACILNDISAGQDDPGMLSLAASRGAPIILMHMKGNPKTMQQSPSYADVVAEVKAFLSERALRAIDAGVAPDHVVIDPGIGFGKTTAHNLSLLRHLDRLAELPYPLLVGSSRKRFIGAVTGESSPADRVFGTAATVAWAVANKTGIVRVHDVEPMVRVVRMIEAIQSA